MKTISRRGMLWRMGAAAGAIAGATIPWKYPARASSPQGETAEGEVFNGFLLMPDIESPLPSWVSEPRGYLPSSIENLAGDSPPTGFAEPLPAGSDLLLYRLDGINALATTALRESPPSAIGHVSRQIHGVTISYESYWPEQDRWLSSIQVTLQRFHSDPVPLWPTPAPGGLAYPIKAYYLPAPGLVVAAPGTVSALWLEPDGLYTTTWDTQLLPLAPESVAARIVRVRS